MSRPGLDNDAIAAAFAAVSQLLELTGENVHRVRSYASVARTIEGLERPAAEMLADGSLTEVAGIGEGTAARVRELVETGRLALLDELTARVPAGLFEVLKVPGLGPKRVREIWRALGVTNLVELRYACLENRLRDLKGFGDKSQENVLRGIGFLERSRGRRLLSEARAAAERVLGRLQREPSALRLAVAGPVRRMEATVEGVDLVATAHEAAPLLEAFATLPFVERVVERRLERGEGRARVVLEDGTPVALHVVPDAAFFAALFVRTGSTAHVEAVRRAAQVRGFDLREDGLFEGRHLVRLEEEADVYRAAGLPPVPPEWREGGDATRTPPPDLVAMPDVRGVLHAHTTWSDGSYGVREMAERAAQLGFSWLAICDHSKAATYAHGLDEARVRAQWAEIDAFNASGTAPLPVLKGIETDVLPDGSLDLDDATLAGFDVVVGSVHSAFGQAEGVMTERLLRAVSHPRIHVLGHPSGRLLLGREGYAFDVERVLDACRDRGTAIELNANPHRLDLEERWLPAAAARGVPVAIDPDAHDLRGIEDVVYGVGAARRAGLRRSEVLTTLDVEAFRAWCARKQGREPAPWRFLPRPPPRDDAPQDEGA